MTRPPEDRPGVVVDVAGGDAGGAARWRAELDAFLADREDVAVVIGRGERVTSGWLLRREVVARRAEMTVATNNVSFAVSGGERRVLLRNALHFLYRSEDHLLRTMPRAFHAQIAVTRALVRRAHVIVTPTSAMADRVVHVIPSLAARIVVRPHPVTTAGPHHGPRHPFILAPVVPGPYKNLFPQLQMLVAAADRLRHPARVLVTADACDLPGELATNPRVEAIGVVPHHRLAALWQSAYAAFYPSAVESFGYPLAEARSYGIPVLAPSSSQALEVAGHALCGYDPTDPSSLIEALQQAGEPVSADPGPFHRGTYFDAILGPSIAASRNDTTQVQNGLFQ